MRTYNLYDVYEKSRQLFFTPKSLLFIFILILSCSGTAFANEDADHIGTLVPLAREAGGPGTESAGGVVPGLLGQPVEMSPLIKKLHGARRAGDTTTVLEVEAMLRKPRILGEDRGDYTVTPSLSRGGPGDPNHAGGGDSVVSSEELRATFGTDIIVRNLDTMEINQSMASDSNGNLYVAMETDLSSTGDFYIQIYWSSDGGQTWTAYGYVLSSGANLRQPSIAIGQGSTDSLLVAYIVEDGTNIRHPEVAVTPLGLNSFTIVSIDYIDFWESYDKPVIWTDSYDYSNWFAYLTCEATFESAAGNINVAFWRSIDYGVSFSTHYTAWGNLDAYAWRDPDGTYGTTLNRVFLACFNDTDKQLYALSSDDFGANWNAQVIVGVDGFAWEDPSHAVDPDIEAATGHDHVMVVFTRGYTDTDTFTDCIGQTYSTDAGATFPYARFNMDGSDYTVNEFAPALTANEGGGSWHLAYTRQDWWIRYTSRPQDLSGYWASTHDVVNDTAWASASYPKKGIASNWTTDIPGIAWSDYRPDTGGDYDTYFDYDRGGIIEPIIRIEPTSLDISQPAETPADESRAAFVPVVRGAPHRQPNLETIRSDTDSLDVKLTTFGMFVENQSEGSDIYQSIHLGRYNGELPPGQPNLPAIRKYVYLPKGKSASLETTIGDSVDFADYLVYPTPLPQSDTVGADTPNFFRDEGVYNKDEWLPKEMVHLGPVEIIRGHTIRLLSICPFQYNPARRLLRLFPDINAQISFEGQAIPVDTRLHSPVYDRFIKGFVLNPDAVDEGQPDTDAYTGENYLIITAPAFLTQANALATHKIGRGISTGVVTTTDTGTTSTQIKAYIQNAYNTYSPAPTYVLLLGDVETIVTTYDGTANTGTDLYYSTVDGSDYVPDVFLGRISVDTASEAQIVIDKIINYETSPPTLPSFFTSAAVAAYFQDNDDLYNDRDGYEDRMFVRTSEEVRNFLLGIGYDVERIYYAEAAVTPTNYNNGDYGSGEPLPAELLRSNGFAWDGDAADISAAINGGISLLMHRDHGMDRNDGYSHTGWGDPYYVETHIASLTNGDLLPVVMSMNCQTGWFDGETDHHASYNYESFVELFLRKSNGGAVSLFGATRTSYSGYNDYMAEGIIDCVWPNFLPTVPNGSGANNRLGPMLTHGKLAMDQLWGDPWDLRQLEYELFHVFGDPSLEMYTGDNGGNTFTIYNDGTADLEITSMMKEDGDAWLNWTPTSPLTISPGGAQTITVDVDWDLVGPVDDDDRIFVYSNDADLSPYPTGVYINADVVEKPDLVVTGITTSPASPNVGDPVNVSVSVANQGWADTESYFYVDWYADEASSPVGIAGNLYTAILAPFGAGTTTTVSLGTYTYASPGNKNMYAQVDVDGFIDEYVETNNIFGPQTILVQDVCNDPPVINSLSADSCIAELGKSSISVSATDPCGGVLTYAWTATGGAIEGSGPSVLFNPLGSDTPCPYEVEVTVTSSATGLSDSQAVDIYARHSGDVNGDGWVNLTDLNQIRDNFMTNGSPGWIPADINYDGWVNLSDLNLIRDNFMSSGGCVCP